MVKGRGLPISFLLQRLPTPHLNKADLQKPSCGAGVFMALHKDRQCEFASLLASAPSQFSSSKEFDSSFELTSSYSLFCSVADGCSLWQVWDHLHVRAVGLNCLLLELVPSSLESHLFDLSRAFGVCSRSSSVDYGILSSVLPFCCSSFTALVQTGLTLLFTGAREVDSLESWTWIEDTEC